MKVNDNEQYKKRIKELIESVEKKKDIPIDEHQIRELKEDLLLFCYKV